MSDKEPEVKEEPKDPKKNKESEGQVVGLSEEQVEALLAKTRKEEKDKLYPKIEELSSTVKTLQDTIRIEQEEKERVRKEAEQKAEEDRKNGLSAEENMQELLKKIEEQLASERKARQTLETKLEKKQREEKLAAYRLQKIQAAGEEILPDLVKGNTEEEIDQSVEVATQRYADLVTKWEAKHSATVKDRMPKPTRPGTTAASDTAEIPEDIDSIDIDLDRYAKDKAYKAEIDDKRSQLQNELAEAYMKAVGGR